jgi:hypothetical protein
LSKQFPSSWAEFKDQWTKHRPLQSAKLEDAHLHSFSPELISLTVQETSFARCLLNKEEHLKIKRQFGELFGFDGEFLVKKQEGQEISVPRKEPIATNEKIMADEKPTFLGERKESQRLAEIDLRNQSSFYHNHRCLNFEPRIWTCKGGMEAIYNTCSQCGNKVGNAIKKELVNVLSLKSADPHLTDDWEKKKSQINEIKRADLTAKKEEEERNWRAKYENYIRSDAWLEKRQKRLIMDRFVCQGCVESKATEVHHQSYANLGNELMFEIISLCKKCHEFIHQEK